MLCLYNPAGTASKGEDSSAGPISFVIGSATIPVSIRACAACASGGKRRIYMPPSMAYGSRDEGGSHPTRRSFLKSSMTSWSSRRL